MECLWELVGACVALLNRLFIEVHLFSSLSTWVFLATFFWVRGGLWWAVSGDVNSGGGMFWVHGVYSKRREYGYQGSGGVKGRGGDTQGGLEFGELRDLGARGGGGG